MLGIENIGYYLPENRRSNYQRKEQFGIDDYFIEEKIGVRSTALKNEDEDTSDMCIKAFRHLESKDTSAGDGIDALIVVTQNPDRNIPHTSAIVHGKLGLSERCACFDISLGCSGFVYSLSIMESFLRGNGLKRGLLFTADPYSKVVDPDDKNTSLLFGDGAAVTLVSDRPKLVSSRFTFGTLGSEHEKLITRDGVLYMNGRAVFNFAAKTIPADLMEVAEINGLQIRDIDRFLLHQGSKIIVETIAKKLDVPLEKVPYKIHDFGNTIASTIPILLEQELSGPSRTIAISGFGVGLSWASGLLRRAV